MRLKLVRVFAVLLLAGLGDARPQQFEVAASLPPDSGDSDAEGWRPVLQGDNLTRKPITLGKDLPEIIEGNSRYTEAARRKSYYVMNNLFHEDRVVRGSRYNGMYDAGELDSGENNWILQRYNIRREANERVGLNAGGSRISRVKLSADSISSGTTSASLEKVDGESRVDFDPSKKKVRNFIRLIPAYSGAKISAKKPARLINDLRDSHDQVSGLNSHQFQSDSDESAPPPFQRPVNGASNGHRLGSDNSREIWVKIKPHVANESSANSNLKVDDKRNNAPRIKVRPETNSSQIKPGSNLKNWPNDNLQNFQDLLNYEKYTSSHDGDDHSETQQVSDGFHIQQNSPHVYHQAVKRPSNKPSITILEHASPSGYPLVNEDESPQGATQWEQIPSLGTNDGDSPVSDSGQTDFGLILDDLQPNRPLNTEHEIVGQSDSNYYGILQGENPFPSVAGNEDYDPVQGQEYYGDHKQEFAFNDSNQDSAEPTGDSGGDHKDSPTSLVSQNTVVHILNVGQKRPNVTVTGMKVPYRPGTPLTTEDSATEQKNSSTGSPNVHIMLTVQEIKGEEGVESQAGMIADQQIPEVSYGDDDGVNCPTVTIHSYTRINNTVEGKEGCTDLNIVINSHVLNTNVYRPGPKGTVPNERYPGSQVGNEAGYAPVEGVYGAPGSGGYTAQDEYPKFPADDGQSFLGDFQGGQQIPGTSTFEVFQQTQINVGSQNDASSNADAFDPGVPNDTASPGSVFEDVSPSPDLGVPGVPSIPDTVPGAEVMSDPVSLTETADGPLGAGIPATPPLGGVQSPLADAGPTDVLADVGSQNIAGDTPLAPASGGSSGIGLPGVGNPLSGITSQLSDSVGNLGSTGGIGGSDSNAGIGSPGSILGGGGDDNDDDDDEDDDGMSELMPFSIMESVTSMLPYFTLLNPLNYGFLSIAISPLAVAVAGLFGLATAFIPWAFSNALDFGRAADRFSIGLKPNIEDVVKQSIHKYRNWNEWKSKRKKRK